jgi:AcrR family transcriptional regulator
VSAARQNSGGGRGRSSARRTNEEWSAETTAELIRLARRELTLHGYEGASVDQIAAAAKLTKGAVYYHFGSKEGLFEAVLRAVQRELVSEIDGRAAEANAPFEALRAGCEAFLELATDDVQKQIVLTDGPRVLGWSKWRAIDAEYGLGSLKQGLLACSEAGVLRADLSCDVVAHWLSGAMNEAVFMIADAPDRSTALAEAKRALGLFLGALSDRSAT